MKVTRACLCLSLLVAAGCGSSGLVYVHRDTTGVDLSSGANTTSPFQVNVGTSTYMGTYVPVSIPSDQTPVGSAAAQIASILARDMTPTQRQEALKDLSRDAQSSRLIDMFSVYSSFAGKTEAAPGALVLNRGNVFATGIAARELAATDRAHVCLELEKLAKAATGSNVVAIRETIKTVCNAPTQPAK